MSASDGLRIVGTAVGWWLGGPVGASIGGAIGGAVGATFDPTQVFEGPRLNDLRIQSSSYGLDIPLVYGAKNRVSGVVIWSSGLIEKRKKEKSGGKGGGGGSETVTYTYRTSAAVALSEGECHSLSRIWANGKLLFDLADVAEEVTRLLGIYAARDAEADAAEAAAAANPADEGLQLVAEEARARADAALANHDAAAANYAAATAGGAPWVIERGTGMPRGPLRYLAFYPGNFTQNPDAEIESIDGAGNVTAYRGTCYIVLGDLQLANFGNSLPNIEVELDGLAPRTVGAVIRDICSRSGLLAGEYAAGGEVDQTPVDGYAISRAQNALAAVTPLEVPYFFETTEQSGEVRFMSRGRGPTATIPPEDYAARQRDGGSGLAPPRFALDRLNDHDIPIEVALTYRDEARDYQENTQRARKRTGSSRTILNVQAPVTMTAAQARQAADRLLWGAQTDRVPSQISVSDKYRFLFPGDVVMIEYSGVYLPMRVISRTRGANGQIDLQLRQEDRFIFSGSTAGEAAAVPPKVTTFVGSTFAAVLNAPILSVTDSDTSAMWVMDAVETGWAGGGLYRSENAGASYSEIEASGERNITGTVAAALPDGPSDIWDRVNTVTVVLRHAAHNLESLDESEILAGKNAVWLGAADGSRGEVLQFATATLTSSSPKTYVLSDLLRGRRATEHETALHGTDELFVFLERDLMRSLDFGSADWDRERLYKGVSVYEDETEVVDFQAFTNLGERAKPRSPVQGSGSRDGANNLTLTWVRRVRGFGIGVGYGALPLDEATEAYEIDVMSGVTVLRTITASSPTASYTAAEQTADGLTPGNPVTVRIYQISATRGRGHAGEFTV